MDEDVAPLPSGYPGPQRPMLAAQLRLASEAAHRFVFTQLRQEGFTDLRRVHFDLFRYPGPHGRTPTALAAHLGMSKQALHPLLNDLERNGYLRRTPDPRDGRGRILELTERGFALVSAIRGALDRLEDQIIGRVTPDGYRQLCEGLIAVRELDPGR